MNGYFGPYGGRYVPETVIPALDELERAYELFSRDAYFPGELALLYRDYAGRPTPLYHARRLSDEIGGARIYLKREDLTTPAPTRSTTPSASPTGAHAWASTASWRRQAPASTAWPRRRWRRCSGGNAWSTWVPRIWRARPPTLPACGCSAPRCVPVTTGSQTLKDATSEAIRDWVTNVEDTYYLIGSVVGPHPYPTLVRDFQAVIGREAAAQSEEQLGGAPEAIYACVGGGSNAIGIFTAFLDRPGVKLIGVEAGGLGIESGAHAATLSRGRRGVLHGAMSYLLCDRDGQIQEAHSVSAGLDYPGVGPEHSWLKDQGRVDYVTATDQEALAAFHRLSRVEGILPALESAHALAAAMRDAPALGPSRNVLVNLSCRGDKDLDTVAAMGEWLDEPGCFDFGGITETG